MRQQILGALSGIGLVLAGCSSGGLNEGLLFVKSARTVAIPAGNHCKGLGAKRIVKIHLTHVLSDLGSGTLTRDITSSEDDGDDGFLVAPPAAAGIWPTELDVKLEHSWFRSTPAGPKDRFVTLRVKLLTSDAGVPQNPRVDFLTLDPPALAARDSARAVRASADNPAMICGRSPIVKTTSGAKAWSQFDVYVRAPKSAGHILESLNIGLLIGPDPNGRYVPLYLDPKVHNDGMP